MLSQAARGTGVAVLAVLALAGAGCSSSKPAADHATTTARPRDSTTTATTAAGPSTTAAGSSTTTTTAPGPSNCRTSQLTATLGAGQGAAGHVIVPLILTNHTTSPCLVAGYPGVSLLDASGATIGNPATRASRPVSPLVLAPGAGAQTELESQNAGLSPTPCWSTSTTIKVFPPNQLDPLTIGGAFQVCGGEFTVTPMASP